MKTYDVELHFRDCTYSSHMVTAENADAAVAFAAAQDKRPVVWSTSKLVRGKDLGLACYYQRMATAENRHAEYYANTIERLKASGWRDVSGEPSRLRKALHAWKWHKAQSAGYSVLALSEMGITL